MYGFFMIAFDCLFSGLVYIRMCANLFGTTFMITYSLVTKQQIMYFACNTNDSFMLDLIDYHNSTNGKAFSFF